MVNIAKIANKRRLEHGKRALPEWVYRPLARLIHQDEINRLLSRYGHLPTYDFLRTIIHDELKCTYEVKGEGLEVKGEGWKKVLFVSNHPLGGLDGMILILALHDLGYDVRVIVNDFLLAVPPLAKLFVPVNKLGRQKREYVELMHELWAGTDPILSFPAGVCSRLIDGQVQDLPWKPTYLKQAAKYHRPIIRIHFSGRNSMFFYRVAQLRKFLRIPFNIEMLLLPRELFHARGHHYDITFTEKIVHGKW